MWVWEHALFDYNPKRPDSTKKDKTVEVITKADHDAALREQVKRLSTCGTDHSTPWWQVRCEDLEADNAALRLKVQELTDEGVKLFEWRLALHSLTPGGSEFCTPKACEDWVRQHRDRQHEHVLDEIKKRKALQDQLDGWELGSRGFP